MAAGKDEVAESCDKYNHDADPDEGPLDDMFDVGCGGRPQIVVRCCRLVRCRLKLSVDLVDKIEETVSVEHDAQPEQNTGKPDYLRDTTSMYQVVLDLAT